jgi:putative drug exporter of the RND superfamily
VDDPFARLSLWVVRKRWLVLGAWAVVVVLGAAILVPHAMNQVQGGGFIVSNSESDVAAGYLGQFHAASTKNAFVVFHSAATTADQPSFRAQVRLAERRARGLSGVSAVTSYLDSQTPGFLSKDRHTAVMVASLAGSESQVEKIVPKLRDRIAVVRIQHFVTGRPAVDEDSVLASNQDLSKAELVTFPVVLILLLLVFRTVASAAIPIVLGACSVVAAQSLIGLLASVFQTSTFALNVGSLIGLGLAIDFSLIVVSRFREEVAAGRETEHAVEITMATAGRSISYSALTVFLAMAVLTLLSLPLMIVRSISLAVVIVALTALLAAFTLLPAILFLMGSRLEWLPVPGLRREKDGPSTQGIWYRISWGIMRHPWPLLGAAVLVLFFLAFPLKDLSTAGSSTDVLPPREESVKGAHVLERAFGPTVLTPIQIVLTTPHNGVWNAQFLTGLRTLVGELERDNRVQSVESLLSLPRAGSMSAAQLARNGPALLTANPQISKVTSNVVNLHGGNDIALVIVTSKYDEYSAQHQQLISDLRAKILPHVPGWSSTHTYIGGEGALFTDFRNALFGRFPFLILAVMAVVFIVLMMFFQSVFLPFKAVLLNLATVLATFGILVVIFQHGFASGLLGFTVTGHLEALTPPILFAILFALSTDYEVFMLSRVKEYHGETHNNDESVARGLQSTAGTITAAGLILVGTFGSFATAGVVVIKEIGLGLAIGVALDTTIVRVVMVPATMKLMGEWNWWMPGWLKRIVPEIREGPSTGLTEPQADLG